MSLQAQKSLVRDSNIELLRIILMLNIIGFHLLVHGAKVASGPEGNYTLEDSSSLAYILLKSFLVLSVNCFVFISGYYRIKFKIGACISLFLQASFYGIAITLLFSLVTMQYLGLRYYLEAFFTIFTGTWWFITAYFALYLLSPLLNNAIDTFTRKQFLFVLINLTVINCVCGFLFYAGPLGVNEGLSLVSFVHIYFLAQYIRKYVSQETLKKWAPAAYIATSFLIFLLAVLSIGEMNERGIERIFAYNNPLVLIAAVSFFFIFQKFTLQSTLINRLSPYVLGVYLFHDHPFMRKHLIENLYSLSQHNSLLVHFLLLALFAVLIFTVGFLVDKVREYLLTPLVKFLIMRFDLIKIENILTRKSASRA